MIGNPYKGGSFKGLLKYLFYGRDDEPNPHRVEWHETRHLAIDDPDVLPRLMRATAGLSAKVKKPVYHLPISWPPEERLDRATQLAIADQLIADLGLAEHECVIVAHNDGQCPHIHLVINTVHPQTGRVWSAWRDIYRIMDSLQRQERERGLRLVHRPDLEDYRSGKRNPDRDREASREERLRAEREGDQPLAPWSEKDMRDVRTAVTKHFRDAASWEDLEERLARHGVELRRAGQGFRITDGTRFMTLSKIGKHARWDILEERFGQSWDDHAATRALSHREQDGLEPPGARPVKVRPSAERGRRTAALVTAWLAHAEYQRFRDEERAVVGEGRKLRQLLWRLRRNEATLVRTNEQLAKARDLHANVMRSIYKNPVQAAAELRTQLRGDKDWPDINLHKIGKVRGIAVLDWKTDTREWAEAHMKSVRRSFTRLWKLEARLEMLTDDWHTLNAKIAAQQRVFRSGRAGLGEHVDRTETRLQLHRKRAVALQKIDKRDIVVSQLHEDAQRTLIAAIDGERQERWDRTFGRKFIPGWSR